MARFRIAQPAQSDLAKILATSAERWGTEGRRRYALLLAAAMRTLAANPEGPLTQARNSRPAFVVFMCVMRTSKRHKRR
jgi:plasmid stabilization system protein ParE